MTRVKVSLGERSYDILIEDGLLSRSSSPLSQYARNGRLIVVTDELVTKAVLPKLSTPDFEIDPIIFPSGETSKSWQQVEVLCDALLSRGVERADSIIALGGGVIGDLTGFAASIVKRGCNLVQIPTTLLAQVDSSVGGKTAINASAGKNLIGAFHQPSLVLIDPSTLDSLPQRQLKAGYAEIVKYGLMGDLSFFEWCETHALALLAGDRAAQVYAIEASVRAKAAIVEADERETADKRALLNLGHTFGHALEAEKGFSDALLHGEAVAAGIGLAFRYAARLKLCSQDHADRVAAHLKSVGLPHSLASAAIAASGAELVAHMLHDKKMSGGVLPFILPRAIGDAVVDRNVTVEDVAAFLDEELATA